jgi:hypothetical protein
MNLVDQTTHQLAKRFHTAGIPYAVMGATAVSAHGALSLTEDATVLLTSSGLDRFRRLFVPVAYESVPRRNRRFVDRSTGVTVHIMLTGHHPGRVSPGPFAFPDPDQASEEINGLRVLTLLQLIQLKLADRRYSALADVVSLIRVHQLNESFLTHLHASVHDDFIRCLEEVRGEEAFEAQL